MNRFPLKLTSFAAACAVLAGLASTGLVGCGQKAPYDVRADKYGPRQVYIATPRLSNVLVFDQIRTSRGPNDLLYVTVPVRSTASKRQLIEYRFTYLDDLGNPLPGGAWQTRQLESNVLETISANSTSNRAANFRMDIREAEAG